MTNANRIFLIPLTPETVIRDPRTKVRLPPEGMWVGNSSYWRRRVSSGDAIEGKPSDAPEISPVFGAPSAPSAPKKAKD